MALLKGAFKMHPLDLSPKSFSNPFKTKDFRDFEMRDFSENNKTHLMFTNKDSAVISKKDKDYGKRGRPRADLLTALMVEGSSSKSKIRCEKCGRVFPREKSLQAHLRTHTGKFLLINWKTCFMLLLYSIQK